MRRLIVELYGKELNKRMEGSSFKKVESMELLHNLRFTGDEITGIFRIKLKNLESSIEESFRDDEALKEMHVLEREKDGVYTVFMRRMSRPGVLIRDVVMKEGGNLFGPIGFKDGRIKLSFVGSQSAIKRILEQFAVRKLSYKVLSVGDADFAPDSLLNKLTDKQRKTLISAYKLGYYDMPRRIDSEELGRCLSLSGATVAEHLRKAERRLISGILSEASTG